MLLFWLACSTQEKTFSESSETNEEIDGGIDRMVSRDLQLITCIQFERVNWSEEDMCKLHLQFYVPAEYHEEEFPSAEDGRICILEPDRPEPPIFSPYGLDAGPTIILQGEDSEIVLHRSTSSHDGVSYMMDSCSEESFPFGQTFDLIVSGSALDEGVPPFSLREAIYVGADVSWETELSSRSDHNPTQDWHLEWAHIQSSPSRAQIKNTIMIETESERLRCDAEPFEITIPNEELQLLEQFHTPSMLIYEEMVVGAPQMLPWGMEYRSVMIYRSRGDIVWQ